MPKAKSNTKPAEQAAPADVSTETTADTKSAEQPVPQMVTLSSDEFKAAVTQVVKGLIPTSETPEQAGDSEDTSRQEIADQQRKKAAQKAKRDAKAQEKREAEAAEQQAKSDAAAAKAFADATTFTGSASEITSSIIRGIAIDNGSAYSSDVNIELSAEDLEAAPDGALLLTKTITLPAKGREFTVKGISLLTDAGCIRVALNGTRRHGGGRAVQFPARSVIFRPAVVAAPAS